MVSTTIPRPVWTALRTNTTAGSVTAVFYSAQSTSSLNNPQHYLQPSPMSSNPSITGSDLMRPDYVPSHRHSALIRRPTAPHLITRRHEAEEPRDDPTGWAPEPLHEEPQHRQLVRLQPSRPARVQPAGDPRARRGPVPLPPQLQLPQSLPVPLSHRETARSGCRQRPRAHQRPAPAGAGISSAQHHQESGLLAAAAVSLPSPSTRQQHPDLSRHLYVSSSNPDLITRRVHHSVQTFQEDSLPVAHSLQEVSEPLVTPRQPHMHKRNSIEIAGLAYGLRTWG